MPKFNGKPGLFMDQQHLMASALVAVNNLLQTTRRQGDAKAHANPESPASAQVNALLKPITSTQTSCPLSNMKTSYSTPRTQRYLRGLLFATVLGADSALSQPFGNGISMPATLLASLDPAQALVFNGFTDWLVATPDFATAQPALPQKELPISAGGASTKPIRMAVSSASIGTPAIMKKAGHSASTMKYPRSRWRP